MELNYEELQILYASVRLFRDAAQQDLWSMPANDPMRNTCVAQLANCNSVLRKVKKFMEQNGVKPIN